MSEQPVPFALVRGTDKQPVKHFMVPYVFAHVSCDGKVELFLPLSVREKVRAASASNPEIGEEVTTIISDWLTGGSGLDAAQSLLVNDFENRGRDDDD